jgi:glycosyltransferase involved in cell wall biosynthesis
MNEIVATVILPTTGDRGLLLPYSVASVLRQSESRLELFIIGDGVNSSTRAIIQQMAGQDSRLRFFDHPKHPRRGEEYRHAALRQASGRIVTYLCDRDLYLPDHVATLASVLEGADFASVHHYNVRPEGNMIYGHPHQPFGKVSRPLSKVARQGIHKLTSVGHTLAAYRRLPYGWRTTPADMATDRYMWLQFMTLDDLLLYHSPEATFLYFKRGNHPKAWSSERRLPQLRHYASVIADENEFAAARKQALTDLLEERRQLRLLLRHWIVMRGLPLTSFIRALPRKAANRARSLAALLGLGSR